MQRPQLAEETAFEDVKFGPVRKATAKSMTKACPPWRSSQSVFLRRQPDSGLPRLMLKPMDAPMGKISLP